MSNRFAKIFTRKGTRGNYGSDDSKRSLPAAQETTVTHASTSKTDKDKKDDAVDNKIDSENNAEKEEDTKDVKTGMTQTKTVDGILKNKAGTSAPTQRSKAYSLIWSRLTDYKMEPVRYSGVARYVPSAFPLRPLLESITQLVGNTNHAMKDEKALNPYAMATGIYYLYYIQILRAQKAAGELVGRDLSALARFEKYNPFNTITIPGPLVPYFESIVAVQLEDVKYNWIVPEHGLEFGRGKRMQELMNPSALDFIRPNVVFMLANLCTFAAKTPNQVSRMFSEGKRFIPIPTHDDDDEKPTNAATRFFGDNVTFTGAMAAADSNNIKNVVQTCGASYPFEFFNDNYSSAHREMRNSRFCNVGGVDVAVTNGLRLPNTSNDLSDDADDAAGNGTKIFKSLDEYLFVAKENNPSWFQYLSEQINTFSRFFNDSKPLSMIASTGGMDTTVICHLKLETLHGTAPNRTYKYEDKRLGTTNYNQLRFYEDKFRNMTGSFTSTRPDIEREEELNAFAFGINSNPPFADLSDAEKLRIRHGQFFQDAHDGAQAMESLRLGFTDSNIKGDIPMFAGWRDEFVKEMFNKKPTNA